MANTTPTPLDLLTRARNLITNPEHWTRGACARNVQGSAVPLRSRHAISFCATAALYRAMDHYAASSAPPVPLHQTCKLAHDILDNTISEITEGRYAAANDYNDATDHQSILHSFDVAISDATNLSAKSAG